MMEEARRQRHAIRQKIKLDRLKSMLLQIAEDKDPALYGPKYSGAYYLTEAIKYIELHQQIWLGLKPEDSISFKTKA